jgi:hypothetical protein
VVGRTPAGSDAHAETAQYEPRPPSRRPADGAGGGTAGRPRRGFDWTPVVAVVVALVSLAAGLLLFTRR